MQYMLYPVICGLYMLFEPQGSFMKKAVYMLPWTIGITFFHFLLGKYTNLLRYNSSHSLLVWAAITLIFTLVNLFVRWFFQNPKSLQAEERIV
ncbi:hypothetical protein D3C73_1476820 [compost metagenome]